MVLRPLIPGAAEIADPQDRHFSLSGGQGVSIGEDVAAPGEEGFKGFGRMCERSKDVQQPTVPSPLGFSDRTLFLAEIAIIEGRDSRGMKSHGDPFRISRFAALISLPGV
jgi:hypothetical protein